MAIASRTSILLKSYRGLLPLADDSSFEFHLFQSHSIVFFPPAHTIYIASYISLQVVSLRYGIFRVLSMRVGEMCLFQAAIYLLAR